MYIAIIHSRNHHQVAQQVTACNILSQASRSDLKILMRYKQALTYLVRDYTPKACGGWTAIFPKTAFIVTICFASILVRKFKGAPTFSVKDIRQCQL